MVKKLGALLIGIGHYAYGRDLPLPPLRYAEADVEGVDAYLKACWPKPSDRVVIRVPEGRATAAALEDAFTKLADQGPYELLVVFLSGHGIVEGGHRGFLLQPDSPDLGLSLLEPDAFDRLLSRPRAERTILILDCCYAEALLSQIRFFSVLGSDRARLFIGSSRASQLTWEEERAGHGVFTAHLLDLLNTGSSASLGSRREVLDVDGELFPILCRQVPLYVLEHKQAEQEPVKGGLSSAAVKLPVAVARRRLRERTPLRTALRRIRQIAIGGALAGLAFLVFAYSMLDYIEPDQSGTLVVRHGTRWLEPVFRYLSPIRVYTGIPVTELSPNPAASYPLQVGDSTGIWTHLHSQPARYRSWFDTLSSGLAVAPADRYAILNGLQPSANARLTDQSRPSEVAFAAWSALARDRPGDLGAILKWLPGSERLISPAISTFDSNELDFDVLDQTADEMESFAKASCYAGALDPVHALPAYIGLAKATQEWLAHNTDEQRGRDARAHVRDAVADCLGVITRARVDRGMSPLDPDAIDIFKALSARGYADVVDTALSRVKGLSVSAEATSRAVSRFHGNTDDADQEEAFETVVSSLSDTDPSRAAVDKVFAAFQKAGNLENSYLTRLLVVAADAHAISPALVSQLVAHAKDRSHQRERTYGDQELALVLSHAMGQIAPADRPTAYRLIELATKDVSAISQNTALIYSALARQRLDRPEMLARVETQARRAPAFRPGIPKGVEEPMPGMTIVVGPGPWVAALAVFGQTRKLPEPDVKILREHLNDPALTDAVIKAMIVQERNDGSKEWVAKWVRELKGLPRDVGARRLRQQLTSRLVSALPRSQFLSALSLIRAARNREMEPEARIAMGAILADAAYQRVSMPSRGAGLGD